MPINVFGNCSSSHDNVIKLDATLFVQKLYLRTIYIKSIIEEGLRKKNQFTIESLPDSISIREACSENYVDKKFNDASIIRNTTHVVYNKTLDNVRSIKVNSFPTLEERLTPKNFVDQAIFDGVDESSILRLGPDENSDEQNSIDLKSSLTLPKTIFELPIKSHVDKKLNNPSIIKNIAHVYFNDKDLDNV